MSVQIEHESSFSMSKRPSPAGLNDGPAISPAFYCRPIAEECIWLYVNRDQVFVSSGPTDHVDDPLDACTSAVHRWGACRNRQTHFSEMSRRERLVHGSCKLVMLSNVSMAVCYRSGMLI